MIQSNKNLIIFQELNISLEGI